MRIDEDIVRAAETQMKRKAPSLHNPDDDDDDYHRDNSTTTNINPSCSPSSSSLVYTKFFHSQYSYPTEKRFVSTNNVKGFAISSIMHREQSAMKEAVRLLFDYTFGVVPNGFEFAPMKVPCKAFAFIACVRPILETENDDDAKNANEVLLNMASNAINNRDKVKIRFLERIYAIMTTCENDEMEIENAIRRLRIPTTDALSSFAVSHRDGFSKRFTVGDDEGIIKWQSSSIIKSVAKSLANVYPNLKNVDLLEPDVVVFVVVLAVNVNEGKNCAADASTTSRKLGLSYATKESNCFEIRKRGIFATSLKS